jgi:hypothetical protein
VVRVSTYIDRGMVALNDGGFPFFRALGDRIIKRIYGVLVLS